MPVLSFLAEKPLLVLALCLGIGFLLGTSKRIKKATRGILSVTVMTIVTAFAMSMLIQLSGKKPDIPDMVTGFFFALFSFSIGYAAGPSLAGAGKGGRAVYGKQAVLCVFYIACAFGAAWGVTRLTGLTSPGRDVGMLAGAQTQSSIVALEGVPAELEGEKMVTYAACYVVGTILMILFTGNIAPLLLRSEEMARELSSSGQRYTRAGLTLGDMVKHYRQAALRDGRVEKGSVTELTAIQTRAYRIVGGPASGRTVGELEEAGFGKGGPGTPSRHRFEILAVYRPDGDKWNAVPSGDGVDKVIVRTGDVIAVVGGAGQVRDFQGDEFEETDFGAFMKTSLVSCEVVITASPAEGRSVDEFVRRCMSECAVVPESIERCGEKLSPAEEILKGDILRVTGVKTANGSDGRNPLSSFIAKVGYPMETGSDSRIGGVMLVVAAAVAVSSLRFGVVSLGTGCVSMLLGLILGWLREKKRNTKFYDATYVSPGALSFIQKLGLNLFIAGKTLGARLDLSLFDSSFLLALLCAALVSLIPLFLGLLFGRRVLRLHPVVLLASLCGSGTCSAALHMLNEKTGSNEFAGSYAIPYALGDILLTLMGVAFIAAI